MEMGENVCTTKDIAERYKVGIDTARKIMREIRHLYGESKGKLPLGRGKCFKQQVDEWERVVLRGCEK